MRMLSTSLEPCPWPQSHALNTLLPSWQSEEGVRVRFRHTVDLDSIGVRAGTRANNDRAPLLTPRAHLRPIRPCGEHVWLVSSSDLCQLFVSRKWYRDWHPQADHPTKLTAVHGKRHVHLEASR